MNWWVLVLVIGLVFGVVVLGPYLFPGENQRAMQRLTEVIQAWAGIRDLEAHLEVLRPGEPLVRLRVLYLAGLAVRLELEEPEELRGEVYALRSTPEGWLLVHFRPNLSLGLEARFSERELTRTLQGLGTPSPKLRVQWPEANTIQIEGLSGPFPRAEIQFGENFPVPERILALDADGKALELRLTETKVNTGLELRELFLLDPLPTQWIPIPMPSGGA